jgi:hypothetical protein
MYNPYLIRMISGDRKVKILSSYNIRRGTHKTFVDPWRLSYSNVTREKDKGKQVLGNLAV